MSETHYHIALGMPQIDKARRKRLNAFAPYVSVLPWFNINVLHKLYLNIFEKEKDNENWKNHKIRAITCADFLHSPAVKRIDINVYFLEPLVRDAYRNELHDRMDELVKIAQFMLAYAQECQEHFLSPKYREVFRVEGNLILNPHGEARRISEHIARQLNQIPGFEEKKETVAYYLNVLNRHERGAGYEALMRFMEGYQKSMDRNPEAWQQIKGRKEQKGSPVSICLPAVVRSKILENINERQRKSKLFTLIVGIDQYVSKRFVPLQSCVSDTMRMQDFLNEKIDQEQRFVTLHNDMASHQHFFEELDAIQSQMEAGDTLLFYFAGYGGNKDGYIDVAGFAGEGGNIIFLHDSLEPYAPVSLKLISQNVPAECRVVAILDTSFNRVITRDSKKSPPINLMSRSVPWKENYVDYKPYETSSEPSTDPKVQVISFAAANNYSEAYETSASGIFTTILLNRLATFQMPFTNSELSIELTKSVLKEYRIEPAFSVTDTSLTDEIFLTPFLKFPMYDRIQELKKGKTTELDLSNLKLISVPQEVFDLSDLTKLDLSNNSLSEIKIPENAWPKLEKLILNDCSFTEVGQLLDEEVLPALKCLSMKNNKIELLHPDWFTAERGPLELDFSDNPLPNMDAANLVFDYNHFHHYFNVVEGNEMDFTTFSEQLKRAKSVGRVMVGGNTVGAGFLIQNNLFITAKHLISSKEVLTHTFVEFGADSSEEGPKYRHTFDPSFYYCSSSKANNDPEDGYFDYVLTKLEDNEQMSLANWGYLTLEAAPKLKVGDPLFMIHYPLSRSREISIVGNSVVSQKDHYLFYHANTKQGSSGAPVFDKHWNVVALHQARTTQNEKGSLTKGEGGVNTIKRGTLTSYIIKDLEKKGFDVLNFNKGNAIPYSDGIEWTAFRFYINDLDGQSVTKEWLTNLEKPAKDFFTEYKEEASYWFNVFNHSLYFSEIDDPYRPLGRPIDLFDENWETIFRTQLLTFINYLRLKSAQNKKKEVRKYLRIDMRISGEERWLEAYDEHVFKAPKITGRLASSATENPRQHFDIRIHNRSNKSIFVGLLTLYSDLGISSFPFNNECIFLKPGEQRLIYDFTKHQPFIEVDSYKLDFHWKEESFIYKFFVVEEPFDLENYSHHPLWNEWKNFQKKEVDLIEPPECLQVQQLKISLVNAAVDNYQEEQLRVYQSNSVQGPILTQLYREQISEEKISSNDKKILNLLAEEHWKRKFEAQLQHNSSKNRILLIGQAATIVPDLREDIFHLLQREWPVFTKSIDYFVIDREYDLERIQYETDRYEIQTVLMYDLPDRMFAQFLDIQVEEINQKRVRQQRNRLDSLSKELYFQYEKLVVKNKHMYFIFVGLQQIDLNLVLQTFDIPRTNELQLMVKENQRLANEYVVNLNQSIAKLNQEYRNVRFIDIQHLAPKGSWKNLWTPNQELSASYADMLLRIFKELPPYKLLTYE